MRGIYFVLGVVILLSLASLAPALDVIYDNSDPGCVVSDTWTTSTSGCYGPNKRMHTKGTGSETVVWTVPLSPGWYRAEFRINSNTSYAMDARYSIVHRDGTENLVINQRRSSTSWFLLGGAYYFNGSAVVTLTDEYTTGTYVVADALRFRSVFSFVQMSDSHVGYSMGTNDATLVANELKTLGSLGMATYGFSAPPPSFAIHSGDTTEYGQQYWNTFTNIINGLPFPVYVTAGNHDSTWSSIRERIRDRHGAPFYSFDHYEQGTRYHFVTLNSPIIQSPRAGFSREELDWLAGDLSALEPNTPVFINLHHPINGASDPKPFDAYRLLETLRPYNAVVIFYGHGHNFNTTTFDNMRIVHGGSTYDAAAGKRGYNIVTVSHDRVHIAKKIYGQETSSGLLNNMLIPAAPAYPTITVDAPAKDAIIQTSSVAISASINGASGTVDSVDFEFNGDGNFRAMSGSNNGPYTANLNLSAAIHGRQWIRVRFTMSTGSVYCKMVPFWTWDNFPKPRWMVDLGAGSQSRPAVADGRVYVGTNGGADGGSMWCVDASDGSLIWKVNMPADVVSSPEVADGRVIFGCGDSKVYALDALTGAQIWNKSCSGPLYGSPTISEGNVYIGSIGTVATNAYLYSINAATGAENWKFSCYAIESKPFVLGNTVFVGAWNSYFYAVNTTNGTQRWRYQRNSNIYYSPADSWPVASASANRVFVADREYVLSAININTGLADWTRTSVSSQGLTPDGKGLLIRNTTGNLERATFDNSTTWVRSASLDSAPVSPSCNGSYAAIVDQDGLVTVAQVGNGSLVYQFMVTQGYQLHPVNVDSNGRVYASTLEGFLLCVQNNITDVEDWNLY